MSTFRVPVLRVLGLEAIPKADRIEMAVIGDYRSLVRKGDVESGDLVAYMPSGSVLPTWLLHRLGLWNEAEGKGKLSGTEGSRISPVRMRKVISEGIVVPLEAVADTQEVGIRTENGDVVAVREGDDVAELLGVIKWQPPIPPEMAGQVADISGHTIRFDIEDRKAYPDVIVEGEPVAYTEKVHGVFCAIGVVPGLDCPGLFEGGDVFVASKLLYAKGLVFVDAEGEDNLHVRVLRAMSTQTHALAAMSRTLGEPIHVLGELYGLGVQRRFSYGMGKGTRPRHGFRAFDVFVGTPTRGRYLDFDEKREFAASMGFELVDLLYRGPHSHAEMVRHRDGNTVTGGGDHIREGVIISPLTERYDSGLGRVVLKEVSPVYLGETDGTELS